MRERDEIAAASGLRKEIGLREAGLAAVVGGIEDDGAGFKRAVAPVGDAVNILIVKQIDAGPAAITAKGAILERGRAYAGLQVVDKAQGLGVPGKVQPQSINGVLANLLPAANLRTIPAGKVAGIVNIKIQQRSRIARTAAVRAENRRQCQPIRAGHIHVESDPEVFSALNVVRRRSQNLVRAQRGLNIRLNTPGVRKRRIE